MDLLGGRRGFLVDDLTKVCRRRGEVFRKSSSYWFLLPICLALAHPSDGHWILGYAVIGYYLVSTAKRTFCVLHVPSRIAGIPKFLPSAGDQVLQ